MIASLSLVAEELPGITRGGREVLLAANNEATTATVITVTHRVIKNTLTFKASSSGGDVERGRVAVART